MILSHLTKDEMKDCLLSIYENLSEYTTPTEVYIEVLDLLDDISHTLHEQLEEREIPYKSGQSMDFIF